MNKEAIESYFRSLCKLYYIAYEQMKRLEKEKDELNQTYPGDDLDEIHKLQQLCLSEEQSKKYLSPDFSEEELAKEEAQLSKILEEYLKKEEKIDIEYVEWKERKERIMNLIVEVVQAINDEEEKDNKYYKISITSREEVIVLINLCIRKRFIVEIFSKDKESIDVFPTEDELCKKFLEAYLENNYKKVWDLYDIYIK